MSMAVDAERDVATAGRLQRMLLPPPQLALGGWSTAYHYQPAGVVSGDYVGLVTRRDRLYFMLGDVSGKGVAASMLMAELHAMFRTLIPFDLSLEDLMTRASALLCASSLPAQYATMVSGYLEPDGAVVMSNAGHPPPLLISGAHHHSVRATGVPMGLFCKSEFSTTELRMSSGETLLVFSDGLTESRNDADEEYGAGRVEAVARRHAGLTASAHIAAHLAAVDHFRGSREHLDDLTVLAIRRV